MLHSGEAAINAGTRMGNALGSGQEASLWRYVVRMAGKVTEAETPSRCYIKSDRQQRPVPAGRPPGWPVTLSIYTGIIHHTLIASHRIAQHEQHVSHSSTTLRIITQCRMCQLFTAQHWQMSSVYKGHQLRAHWHLRETALLYACLRMYHSYRSTTRSAKSR